MNIISEKNRRTMAIIAIIIGLLMAAVVPFLIQTSLERVLTALIDVSRDKPAFKSGLTLFDFFYPLWRAIIYVAGVTLIILAREIRKGTPWTYPLAMLLFAPPSIGGMFMFLPYVSFVEGFPLPMVISWIGLAGFWSYIFLYQGERAQKWVRFAALTFIGMLATHAFVIGIGSRRTMWTRPGYPLYPGFSWWLFNWAGEVNWIAFLLLVASIPLLAIGMKRGWWLAIIGAIVILSIDAPTQFIRTSTLDYLYGSLLAIGTIIFTMVPFFKNRLLATEVPS